MTHNHSTLLLKMGDHMNHMKSPQNTETFYNMKALQRSKISPWKHLIIYEREACCYALQNELKFFF